MIRHSLVVGSDNLAAFDGSVVCRDLTLDLPGGSRTIRRGTKVDLTLRQLLAGQVGTIIGVVSPEPGDVEQPEVSRVVAAALLGDGTIAEEPHQGQVIIHAAGPGVARIQGDLVRQINARRAVLVATALDGRVVETGDTIAVVKAAGLWLSAADASATLEQIRQPAAIRVAAFRARTAGFIAGPRTRVGNIDAAAGNLRSALGRYGTELVAVSQITDDPASIAATYREQVAAGIEIVLIAGSIVLDPGDPFLVALASAGGRTTCLGAPIDPGTMFWVGYLENTAIMGLASCEMYGRVSVLDLVLPYAVAGETISSELLADLGYGGLLDQTFTARQTIGVTRDAPD